MRTDRTFVCTDCRVRCWPVRRCPACGEARSLVDLSEAPALVARGPRERPRSSGAAAMATMGITGIGGSLFALVTGALAAGEVGLLISIPLALVGAARWPRGDEPPGDLRYRALDSPVVRSSALRVSARGVVRPEQPLLRAPLSGRECVAWRLWAEGPHGAIDDTMGSHFVIERGAGAAEIAVDATIASLDLKQPDAGPSALDRPDAALRAWLGARGADASVLVVREAILAPGALVEVSGTTRSETRAAGYRGARTREVMADLPGSPLIVRCPPPGIEGRGSSNA